MDLPQWQRAAAVAARQSGQIMLTIVVIEQDSVMRTLLCEWLESAGYDVRGLGVRAMAAHAGVDLVIVDLLNVATQGAEAVEQVRSSYPGAALIVISTQLSRSLPAGSPPSRSLGVSALVAKPCTRRELLEAVAGAIGAPR